MSREEWVDKSGVLRAPLKTNQILNLFGFLEKVFNAWFRQRFFFQKSFFSWTPFCSTFGGLVQYLHLAILWHLQNISILANPNPLDETAGFWHICNRQTRCLKIQLLKSIYQAKGEWIPELLHFPSFSSLLLLKHISTWGPHMTKREVVRRFQLTETQTEPRLRVTWIKMRYFQKLIFKVVGR